MRITLPSNAEAWVEVDPSLVTVADAQTVLGMVTKAVTDWNITADSSDDKLLITEQNVGQLSLNDIEYIRQQLNFKPSGEMLKELIVALNNTEESNELPIPVEYSNYHYRKTMGITYQEFLATPVTIINQDTMFMNIEEQSKN